MWNTNSNLVEEHSHNNSNVFRWSDISSSSRRHERAVFTFPDEDEEDIQFDTSDAAENRELVDGTKYTSIQEFASAIPNHLLLGSLLEHLCFVYEKDPQRSRLLFKAISKRLVGMNLLSPLAVCDEFSTVRLQHNRAFTELLHLASASLFPQDQRCLNADSQRLKLRFRMEDIFQAQTSRYLSEFEEICKLGKGSYGKVFKVKNKLDGQSYAVKKILIKDVTREDCMKVLREVKVLSSLQHPNIVGYHTAWMEHVQPVRNVSKSNMSACPSLEKLSLKDDYSEESLDSSGGSFIVFENSDSQEREKQDAAPEVKAIAVAKPNQSQAVCPKGPLDDFIPCVFLRSPMAATGAEGLPVAGGDGSVSAADHSSRSVLELNNNSCLDPDGQQWDERCSREGQFHLLLYIQMQLCERSLSDWILERNRLTEELAPLSDPYSCVDAKKTFAILRKILEGVQYIHSRGIMHRDLKPRNIFLHGHDCHVKIGDFGLACKDIIVDATEQLPCTSHIGASSHTTGVGTFVYAAPEVLEGSNYDSKSDMYSMGIVALELFQPFGTEMERVQRLGELRQGNVLETFSQHWPVLAKYIRLLVSPDHLLRPSPAELLRSELFDDTNMVIHSLQRKVEEQEEEILKLKRQISQLQNIKKTAQQTDLT